MQSQKCKIIIIFYMIISIFTFGNACVNPNLIKRNTNYDIPTTNIAMLMDSMFCCVFWPFYWSVELQRPKNITAEYNNTLR